MRQTFLFFLVCFFALTSCKSKTKEKPAGDKFMPVLSFIKDQVAHVDTSVYSIMKISYLDSGRADTSYIKREDFKTAAADFLSIPDISESDYGDRYKEDKQFDETLDRVIITYLPVNPDKETIQREEILIRTTPPNDKITNIIINTVVSTKDSLIEKKMLWKMDESFQVATSRQKVGEPETVSTYKVAWNESDTE
ncbi:MAG: hypothetical protein ABI480_15900 [Chitinophagaceae bacterium]